MPDEKITAPTAADYSINLQLTYSGIKARAEFKGSCLNQDKIMLDHGK